VITAHEIAAGPAQCRDAQRSCGVEDVGTEAVLVCEGRTVVHDATVDAAPQVFDETAEYSPIDTTDLAIRINFDLRHTRI
jgi:hypothetical protein